MPDQGYRWHRPINRRMLRFAARSKSRTLERFMPDPSSKASDFLEIAPKSEPALRAIAMPADTNPHGDIFGGWLLCQMDLAGGTAATRRARGRTATVAITAMTFHRPVFIGDEVTCYAEIIKVGTTSITVK